MKVFFLFFFLNKYFFLNNFKIFRIITGFIINFFYIIEYIFLFILNINFFYFLIIYKYLLKEKYYFNKKVEDSQIFKEKKKDIKKKTNKFNIMNRLDYYRRMFWYLYARKWMYWGISVVTVQLFMWRMRDKRYYYVDKFRNKVIWRLQRLKKKILRGFSYLYFFSNYNIARILFNLENGIFYTLFFSWSLIRFICFFFFVNTIFTYRKIKSLIIYLKIKIFKKW